MTNILQAKIARTRCYAHDLLWNFHQLYTASDASWLQEQRNSTANIVIYNDAPNGFRESQVTYGKPRYNNHHPPTFLQHRFKGPHKQRCYNCIELGHMSINCSEPVNNFHTASMDSVNNLTQKKPARSTTIFYEICGQLDEKKLDDPEKSDSTFESEVHDDSNREVE